MIDFAQDYFSLFELPRAYAVDVEALERAYRKRQSAVHPDRHATADDADKRLALQASSRVNEAYRTLLDPIHRAEYLLALEGIEAAKETDSTLTPDFLEEQLERREALADARSAKDGAKLAALLDEIGRASESLETSLAGELDASRFDAALALVGKLKFMRKLACDANDALADLDTE